MQSFGNEFVNISVYPEKTYSPFIGPAESYGIAGGFTKLASVNAFEQLYAGITVNVIPSFSNVLMIPLISVTIH